MKPRLIIFDFDGTLGDTRKNIVRTFQATMRRLGLDVRDEAVCTRTIGLTLRDGFLAMYPNMDSAEADRCVAKYREIYFEDIDANIPDLFEHVAETLRTLYDQGYTLSIASSRSSPSLRLFIERAGVAHYFTYILGADNVTRHKPDPEPVEKTLRELAVEPSEAIVVGDMPVDILMARNAGVRAVGVSYGNATREELLASGADYVIDDFAELLSICE